MVVWRHVSDAVYAFPMDAKLVRSSVFPYSPEFDDPDWEYIGVLPPGVIVVDVRLEGDRATCKLGGKWVVTHRSVVTYPEFNIDPSVKRAMARVKAITELIDSEASRVRKILNELPGASDMALLAYLESVFFPLAPAKYDTELSMAVLKELHGVLGDDAEERVAKFVAGRRNDLENIYSKREHLCFPLLTQPESLLFLMMVTENPFKLRSEWPSGIYQEQLLFELAAAMGVPLVEGPI